MKNTRLILCVLWAIAVWGFGCSELMHHPDPLAGWKVYFHEPNQTITNDYKDYIQKLPPEEKKYAGGIQYFEDGTGEIAIKFEIPLNGTSWQHILIYNQNSKRIKTIKYASGNYRS